MPPKASDSPAEPAARAPVRRIKYRKPWIVYLPTVMAFVLLNYLVFGTETDDTGKWRILPDYVHEAAERRDNALRDHETPESNVLLFFEQTVMGYLFRLGVRLFGSVQGIQLVLAAAWILHLFELGVCVRICYACDASVAHTLRYCFCTATGGVAQLIPLMRARDEYVREATAAASTSTGAVDGDKKNQ